jgi:hypothetical protein
MRPPPRLRLEPRPSRIARAMVASGCAAMATLVLALPLDAWATAGALLAVALAAGRSVWHCAGRGVPVLLHIGHDRRLAVTGRDGRSHDGEILDDTYVGARLTTIVWRPDRAAWFRPDTRV